MYLEGESAALFSPSNAVPRMRKKNMVIRFVETLCLAQLCLKKKNYCNYISFQKSDHFGCYLTSVVPKRTDLSIPIVVQ